MDSCFVFVRHHQHGIDRARALERGMVVRCVLKWQSQGNERVDVDATDMRTWATVFKGIKSGCRTVPRIFLSAGANFAHLHRAYN